MTLAFNRSHFNRKRAASKVFLPARCSFFAVSVDQRTVQNGAQKSIGLARLRAASGVGRLDDLTLREVLARHVEELRATVRPENRAGVEEVHRAPHALERQRRAPARVIRAETDVVVCERREGSALRVELTTEKLLDRVPAELLRGVDQLVHVGTAETLDELDRTTLGGHEVPRGDSGELAGLAHENRRGLAILREPDQRALDAAGDVAGDVAESDEAGHCRSLLSGFLSRSQ